MRFGSAAVVLMFAVACSNPSEREPVRSLAQANVRNLTPRLIGAAGSATGWSVVPCLGGFAAGAPFESHADFFPVGFIDLHTTVQVTGGRTIGTTVACQPRGPVFLAGGSAGIYETFDAGISPFSTTAVWSIATADQPGLPLLVAEDGTNSVLLKLIDDVGTVEWSFRVFTNSSVGAYATWIPGTTRFAVGDPGAQRVRLFSYEPNTHVVTADGELLAPVRDPDPNFGLALAFGDVNPASGPEVIVGAPFYGTVFVYNPASTPQLLFTLSGPGQGFGNALAVEPGDAGGGLRALWVGVPTLDALYRYVGDAGETTSVVMPDASVFGFALAVENASTLAIGAPLWGDGGAVFEASFTELIDGGALNGQQQECVVNQPCSVGSCRHGRCHGGVLCVDIVPRCSIDLCVSDECLLPNADAGSDDAGAVDAGAVDAGPDLDAGIVSDAGADAGANDGGTTVPFPDSVAFISSCSVGAFSPLLLLVLALLRRQWGPK